VKTELRLAGVGEPGVVERKKKAKQGIGERKFHVLVEDCST